MSEDVQLIRALRGSCAEIYARTGGKFVKGDTWDIDGHKVTFQYDGEFCNLDEFVATAFEMKTCRAMPEIVGG